MSLVLILPVFHVRRVYSGLFFLLSTDSTYSRIPGDQGGPIFFRQDFFSALVLRTNWHTTICITCPILWKIKCNKFVLILIQFVYSNCIRSICTKFDTNLLHTNSLHSISHKNWTCDTNCSTHLYIKRAPKKSLSLKKIGPPLLPVTQKYVESVPRRKKSIPYKLHVRRKQVESILGTWKNMTKNIFNVNNRIPHSVCLVDPLQQWQKPCIPMTTTPSRQRQQCQLDNKQQG